MISNIGFYVQKKSIRLLVKTLKISNKSTKVEIFRHMEKEFLIKKGYYVRKVYMEFFIEMINVFSIKFVEYFGLLDNYIKFLNDKTSLNIVSIELLKRIIPFASDKTSTVILENLDKINKENKSNKELNKVTIIQLYK